MRAPPTHATIVALFFLTESSGFQTMMEWMIVHVFHLSLEVTGEHNHTEERYEEYKEVFEITVCPPRPLQHLSVARLCCCSSV